MTLPHTGAGALPDPLSVPRRQEAPTSHGGREPAATTAPKPRPEHYKVICISLYNEDLARLDELVKDLKRRGFTKANRSAVLRAAVKQFDPARVTRGL